MQGWRCVCGVVMEGREGWGKCRVRQSPMRLVRRLPLDGWGQASRLVVSGGVIDGLRWLSVGASIEFFFLLLDEGQSLVQCPCPYNGCSSTGLFAFDQCYLHGHGWCCFGHSSLLYCFEAGSRELRREDRIHGLQGLRLLGLVRPCSVTVVRPLLVHLFESSPFALVRDAIFLYYLEEPVNGLRLAAFKVLSAQAKA